MKPKLKRHATFFWSSTHLTLTDIGTKKKARHEISRQLTIYARAQTAASGPAAGRAVHQPLFVVDECCAVQTAETDGCSDQDGRVIVADGRDENQGSVFWYFQPSARWRKRGYKKKREKLSNNIETDFRWWGIFCLRFLQRTLQLSLRIDGGLCEYILVYTKLPPSPVILRKELGGKPKMVSIEYRDIMRTAP